jgi:tRNA nucleotidyltransferase (CCA-adding enzyme)
MPIPESQLETWSRRGAVTTAQQTHESVRNALKDYDWPSDVQYEVYLQGSYKNGTNIRGDSDVDIVVQLNSLFRCNRLEDREINSKLIEVSNAWRGAVLKVLQKRYGESEVSEGKKALKVKTPYLPADVVVCLQYRKYPDRHRSEDDFVEGMTFWL